MSDIPPKTSPVASRRPGARSGPIEWEELPSLAKKVVFRPVTQPVVQPAAAVAALRNDAAPAVPLPPAPVVTWDDTQTSLFDPLADTESPPFQETLHGLETREVYEPDVFRHFFGSAAPG